MRRPGRENIWVSRTGDNRNGSTTCIVVHLRWQVQSARHQWNRAAQRSDHRGGGDRRRKAHPRFDQKVGALGTRAPAVLWRIGPCLAVDAGNHVLRRSSETACKRAGRANVRPGLLSERLWTSDFRLLPIAERSDRRSQKERANHSSFIEHLRLKHHSQWFKFEA